MRRTLTVLVASAALLVPATAASAAQPTDRVKTNASCNNGKGGNGAEWNGQGGGYADKLASGGVSCTGTAVVNPKPKPDPAPVDPCVDDPFAEGCDTF